MAHHLRSPGRRDLIIIGEEMVNVHTIRGREPPEKRIEDSEQRRYGLAERGNTDPAS